MCKDVLKHIYRTVVLAKLLYASPAWWGFAVFRQTEHWSIRPSRCSARPLWRQWSYTTKLVDDADERLFRRIKYKHYVLQQFLSDHNSHSYSLRPRRLNFISPTKTDDRNLITRQLFTDIYWTLAFIFLFFLKCVFTLFRCTQLRSGEVTNKSLID